MQTNFALIDWAEIPTDQLETVCAKVRRERARDVITHADVWRKWKEIEPKPKLLPTYDTDRAGYHDMFSFTSKIKKPFPDSPDEPEELTP